jgi:hypothetical protein
LKLRPVSEGVILYDYEDGRSVAVNIFGTAGTVKIEGKIIEIEPYGYAVIG